VQRVDGGARHACSGAQKVHIRTLHSSTKGRIPVAEATTCALSTASGQKRRVRDAHEDRVSSHSRRQVADSCVDEVHVGVLELLRVCGREGDGIVVDVDANLFGGSGGAQPFDRAARE
jgi:hypothetical protein